MRAWLVQPVAMSRLTLLCIAGTLGLLGAAGVIGSTAALRHLNAERERAVKAETLTRDDVAGIARRILRIESPTNAELLAQIRGALRACARNPSCLQAFRAAAGQTSLGDRQATAPALEPQATRRQPPAPRDGRRRPDRRHPSPGPNPSPAPGRPPINVQTPPTLPGPRLCTPLIGINCDRLPG